MFWNSSTSFTGNIFLKCSVLFLIYSDLRSTKVMKINSFAFFFFIELELSDNEIHIFELYTYIYLFVCLFSERERVGGAEGMRERILSRLQPGTKLEVQLDPRTLRP